jgi:nucleoside-diphosphate-sugar epimerase
MIKILITGGNGNLAKIIKKNLGLLYFIQSPSRQELDILNIEQINGFLKDKEFDILIHAAILGGRRTKEETSDLFYKNVLMFENIMLFSDKFKLIINLDSAAIYDRNTNIYLRKETDLFTIPRDFYGFSKYVIYKRGIEYKNFYNLRIFNIFHKNEEPDRFIKSCNIAKYNNEIITIFNDKYFDFVYEDHFVCIIKYYIDNYKSTEVLEKNVNICYDKKYKLSDIAEIIIKDKNKIHVLKTEEKNNYCGDNTVLKKMNIFDASKLNEDMLNYF